MISSWSIYANGEPWELLNAGTIAFYASRVFLTNPAIATEQGNITAHTLGLVLSRSISGGLHEDLDLVNHGMKPVRFNLEIAMRSDFADLFEVKSGHIVRRGRITTEWSDEKSQLRTTYRNKDFCRELTVVARLDDSRPVYANGRISFEVDLRLEPTGTAVCSTRLGNGESRLAAPKDCIAECHRSETGERLRATPANSARNVSNDRHDIRRNAWAVGRHRRR